MTSCAHNHPNYISVCEDASNNENTFANFKRNPYYTAILEHVSYEQGLDYLEALKNCKVNFSDFMANDMIGNPNKYNYSVGLFSPTTFRYIKVAYDILELCKDQKITSVVEIGCGYGGQCFVLNKVLQFERYNMIDLPPVTKLIKKYLERLGVSKFEVISAFNNNAIGNLPACDLLISNYAFSECIKPVRDFYLQTVISKAKLGYMTINCLSGNEIAELHDTLRKLGKNITISPELPLTGRGNYILTWK